MGTFGSGQFQIRVRKMNLFLRQAQTSGLVLDCGPGHRGAQSFGISFKANTSVVLSAQKNDTTHKNGLSRLELARKCSNMLSVASLNMCRKKPTRQRKNLQ